jgi:hypothetical protein
MTNRVTDVAGGSHIYLHQVTQERAAIEGLKCVGDSPHIMIIVFMRVNHFIYTMYNIYTIYTHCSQLFTETLAGSACVFLL